MDVRRQAADVLRLKGLAGDSSLPPERPPALPFAGFDPAFETPLGAEVNAPPDSGVAGVGYEHEMRSASRGAAARRDAARGGKKYAETKRSSVACGKAAPVCPTYSDRAPLTDGLAKSLTSPGKVH